MGSQALRIFHTIKMVGITQMELYFMSLPMLLLVLYLSYPLLYLHFSHKQTLKGRQRTY